MTRDDTGLRIRRALDATAPEAVDPDRIVSDVGARVERRRRRRHRRRVVGSTLGVVALITTTLLVLDRPMIVDTAADPSAPPTSTSTSTERSTTPAPGAGTVVDLPGSGTRATVVAVDPTGVWFARGDALDADRAAPDTVSRVDIDGRIGPSTALRGVAVRGAVSEQWCFLLVDERPELAQGSWRLKRIDRHDGELDASYVLELDGRPVDLTIDDDHVLVRDAASVVVLGQDGDVVERRAAPSEPAPPAPAPPEGMTLSGTSVVFDP